MVIPDSAGSSSARIWRVASYPFITGICTSISTRSYLPGVEFLTFSTASAPFSAVSTRNPYSFRISTAISLFSSLSSTSSIHLPLKSEPASGRIESSTSAWLWPIAVIKVSLISDMNSGFAQNAVTPAALASASISDQSYAVRIMIGVSSPRLRIWRVTSIPFISGRRQSMI